jgi:fructosamine-3-kinase
MHAQIEAITGRHPQRLTPLSGGCISDVYRVDFSQGEPLVAKTGDGSGPPLTLEGEMLRYLRDHSRLPVPQVVHSDARLLLMTYLPGDSQLDAAVQRHAADLVADLHSQRGAAFGFAHDTLIGGLRQPNTPSYSWLDFFREQRLGMMAREAERVGRLPTSLRARVERVANALDRWLTEPAYPALIHGDLWTTNILAQQGRVTGFIDPAIYYADPEIELAFSTLFGTFGAPFFERYRALRPIAPEFFEVRRDVYNLYPLLVHVRLFGGGYVGSVETIVRRLGF